MSDLRRNEASLPEAKPDLTSPPYRRLAEGLSQIGEDHPYVGPSDPDTILETLIRRSVMVVPLLLEGRSLLDAGTGVGLPGLPVALTAPARPVHLIEPRSACVGLLRWLIDQLPRLNLTLHQVPLRRVTFSRLPPVQVLTRSALDWSTLRAAVPEDCGPIIRWSSPEVPLPPERSDWTTHRIRVSWEKHTQEFVWWGPRTMFHVKQSHWDRLKTVSVQEP